MRQFHFVSLAVALTALGASSLALAFPDGATSPSGEEISKHLGGQVFTVLLKNGISWRLDFNRNGYFFGDTSTGGRVTGQWKTEDGKICSKINAPDFSCGDARMYENHLFVRRADGEIIKYIPK